MSKLGILLFLSLTMASAFGSDKDVSIEFLDNETVDYWIYDKGPAK